MQARLLVRGISQAAILAKVTFFKTAVQGAIPTTAYMHHLLLSPLYFVLKAMAPTINDDVAERVVGRASPYCSPA